jgi:hypothetical protein
MPLPLPPETDWPEDSSLDYDVAKELAELGIPHPPHGGQGPWMAYETPSWALKPMRAEMHECYTELMGRVKNDVPMQYHAVISDVVQEAIIDTAIIINNNVDMIDESHNHVWGLHLNLFDHPIGSTAMTDKIVEANVESRDVLIVAINDVRSQANGEVTISAAVDLAITGTVIAVEQAVLTGGVGSVVDLNEELNKNWAEAVNS